MPTKLIFIFYFLFVFYSFGNIRPFVSLSSLWGQGSTGINYLNNELIYSAIYEFVYNLDDGFTYHENTLSLRRNNATGGIRYRRQLHQDEFAPFISYFMLLMNKPLPISLYNDAEYRFNPILKDDYLRSRHILSFYTPYHIEEKFNVRPYIAFDYFFDWDYLDTEKIRLNLGYFLFLEKITARVYYIPWTYGRKENSWDDKSNMGASVSYRW
jgi:hypothetical protein